MLKVKILLHLLTILLPVQIISASTQKDDLWIYINLWQRRLYVMKGQEIQNEFLVGIGKEQTPTPIGEWVIKDKSSNWGGGFGPFWLGLNVPWGRFGIHGTNRPNSVGKETSHGCLRLLNTDIEHLYKMISVGTRVKIEGPILGFDGWKLKTLVRGHKGTLVSLVQNRLYWAGYYKGGIDGIFGQELEKAIIHFQKDYRLEATGQIQFPEYLQLGLVE